MASAETMTQTKTKTKTKTMNVIRSETEAKRFCPLTIKCQNIASFVAIRLGIGIHQTKMLESLTHPKNMLFLI